MKIGILGGTFDPIHWGHLFIAEVARETLKLDVVYFAPAKIPPHKKGAIANAEDRLAMIEMSIAENPRFQVALWDLERETPAYTFETMQELSTRFQDDELYFLIGGDSLRDFSTWKNPEEIIKYCKVVGLNRPGVELKDSEFIKKYQDRFIIIDCPPIGISSTDIRTRLLAGLDVRYYLHPAVYEYIKIKKLYKEKKHS